RATGWRYPRMSRSLSGRSEKSFEFASKDLKTGKSLAEATHGSSSMLQRKATVVRCNIVALTTESRSGADDHSSPSSDRARSTPAGRRPGHSLSVGGPRSAAFAASCGIAKGRSAKGPSRVRVRGVKADSTHTGVRPYAPEDQSISTPRGAVTIAYQETF